MTTRNCIVLHNLTWAGSVSPALWGLPPPPPPSPYGAQPLPPAAAGPRVADGCSRQTPLVAHSFGRVPGAKHGGMEPAWPAGWHVPSVQIRLVLCQHMGLAALQAGDMWHWTGPGRLQQEVAHGSLESAWHDGAQFPLASSLCAIRPGGLCASMCSFLLECWKLRMEPSLPGGVLLPPTVVQAAYAGTEPASLVQRHVPVGQAKLVLCRHVQPSGLRA